MSNFGTGQPVREPAVWFSNWITSIVTLPSPIGQMSIVTLPSSILKLDNEYCYPTLSDGADGSRTE